MVFRELSEFFVDLISVYFFMKFFSKPGHFFGLVGLLLSSIGVVILIYLVYLKFVYSLDIGDRPLLMAGTLLACSWHTIYKLGCYR